MGGIVFGMKFLGLALLLFIVETIFSPNKTRTSKVGAISKAQKAQNIFFENVAQCRKM